MASPHVTVLMSVFNGEPYLDVAMQSIIDQSFPDFEFLVIDDGSTDRTQEILSRWEDPRIRRLENDRNLGLIYSLNRGIKEAKGTYIARMDADDIAHPSRLENQVAFLDSRPEVGVLGSAMQHIDASGRLLGSYTLPLSHELIAWRMHVRRAVAHPASIMSTELVRDAGGYDPAYTHIEDTELWGRLVETTRFANLPWALHARRWHEASISNVHAQRQAEVGLKVSVSLFERTLGQAVDRDAVRAAVLGARRPGGVPARDRAAVAAVMWVLCEAFIARHGLAGDDAAAIRMDLARWLRQARCETG